METTMTVTDQCDSSGIRILGYEVHPLANIFPLLEGKEFDLFVESIDKQGVKESVLIADGKLADGRNRARAVERLAAAGKVINMPTTAWVDDGSRTLAEEILIRNLHRRHLTADQRAIIVAQFQPMMQKESQRRQQESRFGNNRLPTSTKDTNEPATADLKADPPQKLRKNDKNRRSTSGRLAEVAGLSKYKMDQAADLMKHGSPSDIQDVVSSHKKMADVLKVRKAKPAATSAETSTLRSSEPTVEEVARRAWERLKKAIAIADHPELRTVMMRIVKQDGK